MVIDREQIRQELIDKYKMYLPPTRILFNYNEKPVCAMHIVESLRTNGEIGNALIENRVQQMENEAIKQKASNIQARCEDFLNELPQIDKETKKMITQIYFRASAEQDQATRNEILEDITTHIDSFGELSKDDVKQIIESSKIQTKK